ncbi:MAG: hypothetical protein J6Q79_00465, partial [Clostridia bacterium]|nr:hypothetical protein [Clostridia bacterium]
MKQKLLSAAIIIFLVAVVIAQCIGIKNIEAGKQQLEDNTTHQVDATVQTTTQLQTTTQPQVQPTQPSEDVIADNNDNTATAPSDSAEKENGKPESTKEIIDQYTLLVDKFKQQKPAYKKKEYQALPVEYHNFSSLINKALDFAAGYMVTEDEAEELVRAA